MNNSIGKKLLSVIILDILYKRTDEYTALSTSELLQAISERGVECNRKTLYANINALNNAGYEIMRKRSDCMRYYVIDRVFDKYELRILLDAVQAAVFIAEDKSNELCGKIAGLAGTRGADIIKNSTATFNITKTVNGRVVYSVNAISEAIIDRRKITFSYFDYDFCGSKKYRGGNEHKTYTVNPLATVFSDDKYYLVCYHDNHDNITHYRIDRMDNVEVTDIPISEKAALNDFDIRLHKKQLFGMFSGDTVFAEFEAENEDYIVDAIFDKFGYDTVIKSNGDGKLRFAADVQLSDPFVLWVCSFGGKMRVVSPDSAVDKMRGFVALLYDRCCSPQKVKK